MPSEPPSNVIVNRRYSVWPQVVGGVVGLTLGFVACGASMLAASSALKGFGCIGALVVCLCGFAVLVLVRLSVRALELRDVLVVVPAGPWYSPAELLRIEFSPDPLEDYADSNEWVRHSEVRIYPTAGRELRLIVTVCDGRTLRSWAGRHGVSVNVTAGALEQSPDGD
jgi:hypothetical protein